MKHDEYERWQRRVNRPPYSEYDAIVRLGKKDALTFFQSRQECLNRGGCTECFCTPEQGIKHWKHCSKFDPENNEVKDVNPETSG